MITLKRNPIVDTKMIKRKTIKAYYYKNKQNKHTQKLHQITKEERKRRTKNWKFDRPQWTNGNSKLFPINNYFK